MILSAINAERFLDLVRTASLIAFQEVEYGYALAAEGEAYYAPIDHPGGGNLPPEFVQRDLGVAFIKRMSRPALRTLRPTAKPVPTNGLLFYLHSFGPGEAISNFPKAAGDFPAMIEHQTQVVIQAIEEHDRPDLKDAMSQLKRDALSDALDIVIQHAEAAREAAEVGDDTHHQIRIHIMQTSQAVKSCLELLLKP